MAKTYTPTESQIPERNTQSLYGDIVADFIAQGAESGGGEYRGHEARDTEGGSATSAQRQC